MTNSSSSKSMTLGELKHQIDTILLEDKKAASLPVGILAAYFHDGTPCDNPVKGIEIHRGMHHGKREKYLIIV